MRKTVFILFWLCLALSSLFLIEKFRWHNELNEEYKYVVHSDGRGYYSYLPALFLRGDFGQEKYERYHHVRVSDSTYVSKYTYGTSFFHLPFFAGAAVVAKVAGYEMDGYSPPFQVAISLAGWVYWLWGLWLAYLLFTRDFGLGRNTALTVITALAFGAPLVYYMVFLGSFSHVYSFFLVTALLYIVFRFRETQHLKWLCWGGLVLGLIVVTRPVNAVVVLFLPVCFHSGKEFLAFLRQLITPWKRAAMLILFGLIPVLVQCWLWYLQTGSWFVWSYKGEGFYFSNPRMWDFLFSYQKGFFVYAPLWLLMIPALWLLWKKSPWRISMFLVFFVFTVYFFSSWWSWYYAESFSMRPMTDFSILWMCVCVLVITALSGVWRKIYVFLLLLFIPVNLVFAYQHYHFISHPNAMTAEKFWYIFFKTDKSHRHTLGGMREIQPYSPHGLDLVWKWETDFSDRPGGVLQMEGQEFPLTEIFEIPDAPHKSDRLWAVVRYQKRNATPEAGKDVLLVFHGTDPKDSLLSYYRYRIKEMPHEKVGEWTQEESSILLFNRMYPGDKIGVYFWNRKLEALEIDNFSVEIFTPHIPD